MERLVEVFIMPGQGTALDDFGNFVISFWRENEEEPRGEMRTRVGNVLQGPVLSLLQSLRFTEFHSIISVEVRDNGRTASLRRASSSSLPTRPTLPAYLEELKLASTLMGDFGIAQSLALCDLESISFISAFEAGSVGAYLVKTKEGTPLVLKILLETDALLHTDDEIFSFTDRLAAMYRELRVVMTITPHDNIIKPPVALIVVPRVGGPVVCGFLTQYHAGGNLRDIVKAIDVPSLARRIRWAAQIASAVHHLHRVAGAYHGDLKLDNVVISDNDDAILIDLEQGRHAEACLAPEANGEWDIICSVEGHDNLPPDAICYIKYDGPEREDWSAYVAWKEYPKAIEAIEVYSLGVLLESLFHGIPTPDQISALVKRCLLSDPTARPSLSGVLIALLDDHY